MIRLLHPRIRLSSCSWSTAQITWSHRGRGPSYCSNWSLWIDLNQNHRSILCMHYAHTSYTEILYIKANSVLRTLTTYFPKVRGWQYPPIKYSSVGNFVHITVCCSMAWFFPLVESDMDLIEAERVTLRRQPRLPAHSVSSVNTSAINRADNHSAAAGQTRNPKSGPPHNVPSG